MRVSTLVVAVSIAGSAGCFEEDVGSSGGPLGIQPSNGVTLTNGIDADEVTTLTGYCEIDTDIGAIECEGLIVRANEAGVANGIGYQRLEPVETYCAGDAEANAPAIGVFSFGSLIVDPLASIYFNGERAVALVAARSIKIRGRVPVYWNAGGFTLDNQDDWAYGPGAPAPTSGEDSAGAAGAAGSTEGGAGGNGGGARTSAVPPQFEPICGGSTGGSVGHRFPDGGRVGYRDGGSGGGAIILAAGESIELAGGDGCGVFANGGTGSPGARGGAGGGAGGTISLEAPSITVSDDCWITANGAGGSGGACSTPEEDWGWDSSCAGSMGGLDSTWAGGVGGEPDGGDGGDGGHGATPPVDGDDSGEAAYGGGGGGAAGFIRLRTNDCTNLPANISPPPSCEVL